MNLKTQIIPKHPTLHKFHTRRGEGWNTSKQRFTNLQNCPVELHCVISMILHNEWMNDNSSLPLPLQQKPPSRHSFFQSSRHAKYYSGQAPRGKVEKNFEVRVQQYVKPPRGKRVDPQSRPAEFRSEAARLIRRPIILPDMGS